VPCDGRCFVRLDSCVSNMFDTGMRTMLALRLVSIVWCVFDQTYFRAECFDRMFDGLQILSNTTKHDQTRSNTIKHDQKHQTRCPNGKMFVHQTLKCLFTKQCLMVFGSPNIYRLLRALGLNLIYRLFIVLSSTAESKEPNEPLNLVCLPYFQFFGDFLIYLEINSFPERISKIYGNRKFWRFGVALKLKFEVKNW